VAAAGSADLTKSLDEAPLGRSHLRPVVVAGMGFFTDAYDLFVIGVVSTLVKQDWHLDTTRLAMLNATMLGAAFLGAVLFGWLADRVGRRRVYWLVATIMVIAAVCSALAPTFWLLIVFRFLLGLGVGGNYPISAVLMTEYANRRDRGRLVSLVFSTQALGLVVGPLTALAFLGAGTSADVTWRILLAIGAVPAAAMVFLRHALPESPRYEAHVRARRQAEILPRAGDGSIRARQRAVGLRRLLTSRRLLVMLAATAGCWFLLDYAYYGNTISTPQIISLISPRSSTMTTIGIQLAIFTIAALPGYALAIARIDRVGHRRLQLIGFGVMAVCFATIGLAPGMTTAVAPFLVVYGISYFFTEFGPNVTTFVLPGEVFPVSVRATGHGISAGIGKLGAFIGVFLFPVLQTSLGLRGTLLLTAGVAVLGCLLTLVLPEPAGQRLDDVSASVVATAATGLARTGADIEPAPSAG
jgi:MFS transporter, PHS family, inorganic phosphate transporter